MNSYKVIAYLLLAVVAFGCSNAGLHNPMSPEGLVGSTVSLQPGLSTENNHYLWGLWGVRIDVDRQSADIVPLRLADIHLNVLRKLEVDPCTDCLKIDNVVGVAPNEIEVNVTLKHPYPDAVKFTGFDVRGIFITGADYYFPGNGHSIAWSDSLPKLLNPDGYTNLFNPTEFPGTLPVPAILKYYPGKKATGGGLNATLNPYVAYAKDVLRRMFETTHTETRTARIWIPPGSGGVIEFGYAVDASWKYVEVVNDPVQDFPPNANCIEAYRIDVIIKNELAAETWSYMPVRVEIYDHQGFETISTVSVEAPDLFSGEKTLDFVEETAEGGFLFEGTIGNELGAKPGKYPLSVRVEDIESDPNFSHVDGWNMAYIPVMNGWAQTWDGGTTKGVPLALDSDGNIYISGQFGSTGDFDPGPDVVNYASNGKADIYLSKFDPSGKFKWARTWGGIENDFPGDIAVDGTGNIYVTGSFAQTVDFDPGPGVDEHTAASCDDIFLVKYNESGDFQWARTWGGYAFDYGWGVTVSNPHVIYVTGSVYDEFKAFLNKFDSSGDLKWARTWGEDGDISGRGVAVVGSNVLVVGYFGHSVDFDPGPGVFQRTSNGYTDAFLSQFDNEGNFQGAYCWGGNGQDSAIDLATDGLGNGIIVGQFQETVDFNPGSGFDWNTASQSYCFYVSKFDSSGYYQWVRTWGGPSWVNAVDTDTAGNIFIVGGFEGSVDFDPGLSIDERTANSEHPDVYLIALNVDGAYRWARTWGGASGDFGQDVGQFGDQRIYVTGSCNSQFLDFDPGPGVDEHRYIAPWGGDFLAMFPVNGLW